MKFCIGALQLLAGAVLVGLLFYVFHVLVQSGMDFSPAPGPFGFPLP